MEYNPFSKEIGIDKMYKTEDFNEALTRLEFLEKTRGIGLFTGFPGAGKTYTIKYFLENLNTGLYKIVYLPLTSVSVIDFYRALCNCLNLEEKGSKAKMFFRIQNTIKKIVQDQKKHLIIAIDEVQLLKSEILTPKKLLFKPSNYYLEMYKQEKKYKDKNTKKSKKEKKDKKGKKQKVSKEK